MDITPELAKLLHHCRRTGGYMTCDPIDMPGDVVDQAEELGLVDVENDGTAVLTALGVTHASLLLFVN